LKKKYVVVIIFCMSNKITTYKKLITDYYKPFTYKLTTDYKSIEKNNLIKGYNYETDEWHCLSCGISMGKNNPRQLCKKIYCENI